MFIHFRFLGYRTLYGTPASGNDLKWETVTNLQECADACKRTAGCIYFELGKKK